MTSIFFQAVGKPIFAVLTSLIRDIICFVPLIIILPIYYGIDGILAAAPFADLVAMIVTVILTLIFFRRIDREVKGEQIATTLNDAVKPAGINDEDDPASETVVDVVSED